MSDVTLILLQLYLVVSQKPGHVARVSRAAGALQGLRQIRRLLARDASAAVRFLAKRSELRKLPICLLGLSQAGWIMPIAASNTDSVGFMVFWSGLRFSRDVTHNLWIRIYSIESFQVIAIAIGTQNSLTRIDVTRGPPITNVHSLEATWTTRVSGDAASGRFGAE